MSSLKQNIFAVLAALIWGTAFVAQSVSAGRIGAFTFTFCRSLVAAAALLAFILMRGRARGAKKAAGTAREAEKGERRAVVLGGVLCGVLLTAATNLQQLGLAETPAGKAGFITSLYVVLVPVFAAFLGRRAPLPVWTAVVIAAFGLYFLCVSGEFAIAPSDFLVLLCSFVFAGHILAVDRFVASADPIKLSCVQFAAAAALSGVCALAFETVVWADILSCLGPILYVGVFSSGVAYTLQIYAQKGSDPAVISILLSLESVFSVIAGAVILGDSLLPREYFGCALMFAAVLLAQIPFPKLSGRRR